MTQMALKPVDVMASERVKQGVEMLKVNSGSPLVINSFTEIPGKSMFLPVSDLVELQSGDAHYFKYNIKKDQFLRYPLSKGEQTIRLASNLPRNLHLQLFLRDRGSERAKLLVR